MNFRNRKNYFRQIKTNNRLLFYAPTINCTKETGHKKDKLINLYTEKLFNFHCLF